MSTPRFSGKRIIVLGDVMLDRFVYGTVKRISPEAPVPVFLTNTETVMLGGAGNVARNIAALGGHAILIGAIGNDVTGRLLEQEVAAIAGITSEFVKDNRPTTSKIRYVADQQQVLRADSEDCRSVAADLLFHAFEAHLPDADGVILSDYAKGVLTPELLKLVIGAARRAGKPIVADPKCREFSRYDGVTLLTPNASEASVASDIVCENDDAAEKAAAAILAQLPQSGGVLITRGPKGMTLIQHEGEARHFPARAREVFDVSGAGDTVIATLALCLTAGDDYASAVRLSNVAAGLSVAKRGTAVVTVEELSTELRMEQINIGTRKVLTLEEALPVIASWRAKGQAIGFTNGCFDLIHPGHVSQLSQARANCDRLIVGLNSDASVKRLKGPERPIQDEIARSIVLASLSPVDLVIIFEDDTPLALIGAIRPDVLLKGKDYTVATVVGADVVQSYGGRVVLTDIVAGHSTTNIVSRLAK